jgi:hypothetical protein
MKIKDARSSPLDAELARQVEAMVPTATIEALRMA